MHVNASHKTTISVKLDHITEKMSSGFPSDVLRLLCLSAAFYFSRAVTNNDLRLQLQLQNLRESQS